MFVVTGGGSGIGRALAHALAQRGEAVLIVGRRKKQLLETARYASNIDCIQANVSTEAGRMRIANRLEGVPKITGLIHNAGIIEPITPLSHITVKDWRQVMATNLEAPLFLTQLLQPRLSQGRVLNVGSGAAYIPIVGWSAYCVSKAGLSMLTRCWQLEYPNLAFAHVKPGIIDTAMQGVIRNASHMEPDKREFFEQLYQSERLLTPETVAAFLCWLLLEVGVTEYVSQEWDIYDPSHHHAWLKPPYAVPNLE